MHTVTGIFTTWADAARAVEALRVHHFDEDEINVLTPGSDISTVPTATGEQPGIGGAIGGVAGGAAGAAVGMQVLAATASGLIPGVGPVLAVGAIAGLLAGIGGRPSATPSRTPSSTVCPRMSSISTRTRCGGAARW